MHGRERKRDEGRRGSGRDEETERRRDGETERLRAMENGLSVIPHKAKGARGFAGRKPGNGRDVETVGNHRVTCWSTDCGSG